MNLGRCMRLAGLTLAVGFACFSCTFPSVEYDAASSSPSTSCAAPMSCAKEGATCGNKAQSAQNMCSTKCSMTCVDCEEAYDLALANCVTTCEICSAAAGCADATASCKALLGVP